LRIRALPGPAAHTPIIALTANVLDHQRQAYLDCGMNGVVGKPISPAGLLRAILELQNTPRPKAEATRAVLPMAG
jgi:CheY-like chemotaxis protein